MWRMIETMMCVQEAITVCGDLEKGWLQGHVNPKAKLTKADDLSAAKCANLLIAAEAVSYFVK